jgi:hypothetical protein
VSLSTEGATSIGQRPFGCVDRVGPDAAKEISNSNPCQFAEPD